MNSIVDPKKITTKTLETYFESLDTSNFHTLKAKCNSIIYFYKHIYEMNLKIPFKGKEKFKTKEILTEEDWEAFESKMKEENIDLKV